MSPTKLFSTYVETENLTTTQERELIASAQQGCQESYGTLILQYAPLLKKYAAQAPGHVENEDVQGALMLGLVEAVQDFDLETHSVLATTLPNFLRRAMSEMGVTASSFTIPSRSLSRWLSILKKAEGNVYSAINIAPKFGMARETFLSIHTALRSTNSLDAVLMGDSYVTRTIHVQTQEPVGESDNEIADMVFETKGDENDLSDREAMVLRFAYGWMTYGDAMTDDAVGQKLGMSRPSVQRIRQGALEKARRRLGMDA